MPFPAVIFLITERSADPSLGSPRMGAGSKNFTEHRHAGATPDFNGGTQASQTGADDNGVEPMRHLSPRPEATMISRWQRAEFLS
jgi:hypothetical protein